MARKPNSYNMTWGKTGVQPNQSVNLGASSVSDPLPVAGAYRFSVNSAWTTTSAPVGTLSVQVCNAWQNDGQNPNNSGSPVNWVTLTALNLTLGTDPSPAIQLVVSNAFGWMRLVYTRTSGGATDTLSAQIQHYEVD